MTSSRVVLDPPARDAGSGTPSQGSAARFLTAVYMPVTEKFLIGGPMFAQTVIISRADAKQWVGELQQALSIDDYVDALNDETA